MTALAIAILIVAAFGGLTLFIAMESDDGSIGKAAVNTVHLLGALAGFLGVIGVILWALDHLSGIGVPG